MAHGLENIVAVAEKLKHHDNICFIFAGGGATRKKIVDLVNEKRLHNVILIDRQPKEMMPRIWSLCDVSLVPLVNNSLFSTVIPSKIFECMAMGIPTIMSVPEGEATEIIRNTNSGITVDCEDVEQIANAIIQLSSDPVKYEMIRKSSITSSMSFSRNYMADKMIGVLEKYEK
jgi:glycosyltransferase involved in cell wall biosynthesis